MFGGSLLASSVSPSKEYAIDLTKSAAMTKLVELRRAQLRWKAVEVIKRMT